MLRLRHKEFKGLYFNVATNSGEQGWKGAVLLAALIASLSTTSLLLALLFKVIIVFMIIYT